MSAFDAFSLKVKNFKCFGEEAQGFDRIKAINLLLGRNNSGKSSLLDLVRYATNPTSAIPQSLWHFRRAPEILAQIPLAEGQVRKVFSETKRGSGIPAANHYEFGKLLVGSALTWRLDSGRFVNLGPNSDGDYPFKQVQDNVDQYLQRLAAAAVNPFQGKEFRKISAERNINPERHGQLTVQDDGRGVTNSIQNFLTQARLPSELVEKNILHDLNQILGPDATFRNIVCQQIEDGLWEIFLEEEKKGRIPLSQSGSGLKTIIMILCYFHLLPEVQNKELSEFVFAFEELENNLHPSLLRRMLSYI
ncbi:MAG TPA: AAA family ATPase, partial [Thermoanaerobaculia bacterium]|nr:AAA family ATPase [Thermoanaerobaculia bacterium]